MRMSNIRCFVQQKKIWHFAKRVMAKVILSWLITFLCFLMNFVSTTYEFSFRHKIYLSNPKQKLTAHLIFALLLKRPWKHKVNMLSQLVTCLWQLSSVPLCAKENPGNFPHSLQKSPFSLTDACLFAMVMGLTAIYYPSRGFPICSVMEFN